MGARFEAQGWAWSDACGKVRGGQGWLAHPARTTPWHARGLAAHGLGEHSAQHTALPPSRSKHMRLTRDDSRRGAHGFLLSGALPWLTPLNNRDTVEVLGPTA